MIFSFCSWVSPSPVENWLDDFRQRVHRDLRRRNDLVVGIAELVAARAVVGLPSLWNVHEYGSCETQVMSLPFVDLVGDGRPMVAIAHDVAEAAGHVGILADAEHDHVTFCP